MSGSNWMLRVRRAGLFCVAIMLSTVVAGAQSTPANATPKAETFSSSQGSQNASTSSSSAQLNELSMSAAPDALPSAPAPSASAAGQYGNNGSGNGGMWQRAKSRFAFEAGGGFNAPESSSVKWGGNFTIGAGLHFDPHFATLIEYQFIRTGISDQLIAQAGSEGGYAHIWSFTLDPVVDFFPNSTNDFYVTGGGGFYRKVTNFTNPQAGYYCDYYGFCYGVTQNVVVGHFSSNQGGWNIGGGFTHRFGGIYGTGKLRFFAEARYLDVLTPAVTGTNPTTGGAVTSVPADTKLIPVTFGFRW